MAIKNLDMVKTVFGNNDLTLKAEAGSSLKVKAIRAYSDTAEWLTVKIDKTTVGYFRISNVYGNHLAFPRVKTAAGVDAQRYERNLLDLLSLMNIFTGYPVAEGQTFIIPKLGAGNHVISVIYDEYDAGDIKKEDMNGTDAKDYFFMGYGDTGSAIASAGDFLYSRSLTPVEFPAFPFGVEVPSKSRIELYGICGSEVGVRNATPATAIYTQYLKLVKERTVLFDNDRNGLLFDYSTVSGAAGTYMAGGNSVIGGYTHLDSRLPYFFTEPLVFDSGEELNIYVTVAEPVDGSSIATSYQVIGLPMIIRRE